MAIRIASAERKTYDYTERGGRVSGRWGECDVHMVSSLLPGAGNGDLTA